VVSVPPGPFEESSGVVSVPPGPFEESGGVVSVMPPNGFGTAGSALCVDRGGAAPADRVEGSVPIATRNATIKVAKMSDEAAFIATLKRTAGRSGSLLGRAASTSGRIRAAGLKNLEITSRLAALYAAKPPSENIAPTGVEPVSQP